MINYPDRISRARLPTPVEPMLRLSKTLGVPLLMKRDDLTGSALSGNKIRKLEFLFAEARAQGADTVITCGGEQSNHCRATAVAAAQLGLGSYLLLYPRGRVHVMMGRGVVPAPAIVVIGLWFVLQLFSGIGSVAGPDQEGGVAYMAHVGGFVAGFLLTFLLRGKPV